MPVTRQQRQVTTRNIGVVNVDTGAEQVWQAVSRTADMFGEHAFKAAARQAKQTVEDRVQSMTNEDLFTIDPETGKYSNLNIPSSYGQIAADAHRTLIRQRFMNGIEDELKRVGQEYATKYNSAQYKEMMSKHVQSMIKAAQKTDGVDTPFSAPLTDIGNEYVARTYAALRDREIAAAKKANENAAILGLYNLEQELGNLAATGQFGPTYLKKLGEFTQLNQALYESSNNAAQYVRNRKVMQGIEAVAASGRLSTMLGLSDDPVVVATAKRALEGDATAIMEITDDAIRNAVNTWFTYTGGKGGDAVIRSIEGVAQRGDEATQAKLTEQFDAMPAPTAGTTLAEIHQQVMAIKNVVPEASPEELALLSSSRVMMALQVHAKDFDGQALTAFADDLRSGEFKKSRKFFNNPDQVEAMFDAMSEADKATLNKSISERYTTTSRLESEQEKGLIGELKLGVIGYQNSMTIDVIQGYKDKKAAINAADIPDTDRATLLTSLDNAYADRLIKEVQSIRIKVRTEDGHIYRNMSKDEVELLASGIRGDFNIDSEDLPLAIGGKFQLLKRAYKINPSSVDRALGAMIKSADSNAQRELAATNRMLAENEVELGIASPEQFKLWEQTYGLDKLSLGEMVGVDDNGQIVFNDNVRFAIEKGYLPTKIKQMATSIGNGQVYDRNIMEQAFQLFEQSMNIGDSFGNTIDVLERNVPSKEYGIIAEAIRLSREGFGNPADIIAQIGAYDGNIDQDIKGKLDNKTLDQFVGEMVSNGKIGSHHATRVKSLLRLNYANGNIMDVDGATLMVENHFANVGAQDAAVFAPGFAFNEKNEYARFAIRGFTANNAAAAEKDMLVSIMQTNPELFERDAVIDIVQDQFIDGLFGPFTHLGIVWDTAFGSESDKFENWKYLTTEARISKFAERLQGSIIYKPVTGSFVRDPYTGEMIEGTYLVGLENQSGGFTPFMKNGEVLKMNTREYQDKTAWFSSESVSAPKGDRNEIGAAGNRLRAAIRAYGPQHENVISEYGNYIATLPTYQNDDGSRNEAKIDAELKRKFPQLRTE